jgi:hypothetical protein
MMLLDIIAPVTKDLNEMKIMFENTKEMNNNLMRELD